MFFIREKNNQGNAFFLILLVVILFGALSFAVSQSSRDSGISIDKETVELEVVQFLQDANFISTTFKRKNLVNNGYQIQFTKDAATDSGTVYHSDRTTSTGRTVGFFTADISGRELMMVPSREIRTTGSSGWGVVYNSRLVVDGADVGTSDGDTFIRMRHLTEEACKAINKGLYDDDTIPGLSGSWGSTTAQIDLWYGQTKVGGAFLDQTNIGVLPGCNGNSIYDYTYFELIEDN